MTKQEIIEYLSGGDDTQLFRRSSQIRQSVHGSTTFLRGLIEFSNRCVCDCLYCGIRASNSKVERYDLTLEEVLCATQKAYQKGYRSVVLQAGEKRNSLNTHRVTEMVTKIKERYGKEFSITLSCGVQSHAVLKEWKEAGADRYLLRIESSSKELFKRIHPPEIDYTERCNAISTLKELGYITGSGMMIGLPWQTIENLADDLLWLQQREIDMCGMGPYVEHSDAPLSLHTSEYSNPERVALTLRCIALLRIMMPHINIASSTALGTLDAEARKRAIIIGANVMMPCMTPQRARGSYNLYEGKIFQNI